MWLVPFCFDPFLVFLIATFLSFHVVSFSSSRNVWCFVIGDPWDVYGYSQPHVTLIMWDLHIGVPCGHRPTCLSHVQLRVVRQNMLGGLPFPTDIHTGVCMSISIWWLWQPIYICILCPIGQVWWWNGDDNVPGHISVITDPSSTTYLVLSKGHPLTQSLLTLCFQRTTLPAATIKLRQHSLSHWLVQALSYQHYQIHN